MNLCVFIGRLVRDPELRQVPTNDGDVNVVNFTLAVDGRKGRDGDAEFFDFEAWGQGADVINKWFRKGDPMVIRDAEARTEKWTDKETGGNRSKIRFRVNRFEFAPINRGKTKDEEAEAPDAGEKVEEKEAAETPPPPRRQVAPKTGRPKRATVPVDDDDDDISF
jgi:single stranded DNA-binding protein